MNKLPWWHRSHWLGVFILLCGAFIAALFMGDIRIAMAAAGGALLAQFINQIIVEPLLKRGKSAQDTGARVEPDGLFPLPSLGPIKEARILRWLKNEGDTVIKGEPLVEIETEKVSFEMVSPVSGRIARIFLPAGHAVQVGEPIAQFQNVAQAA